METKSRFTNPMWEQYHRYIAPVARDPLIRGYFEIMATIILVGFFAVFVIRPTLNTVIGLKKELEDLTQTDKELDTKIANLIKAQQNYAAVENKIKYLDLAMPTKPTVDDLVIDLENISKSSKNGLVGLNVSSTGLTADAWKNNAGYKDGSVVPLVFSVSSNGDFNDGIDLLRTFLRAPRLLSIDSVSFASGSKESGEKLTISYSGKAFFLP